MNVLLNFGYINSQKTCPLFSGPRSYIAAQVHDTKGRLYDLVVLTDAVPKCSSGMIPMAGKFRGNWMSIYPSPNKHYYIGLLRDR